MTERDRRQRAEAWFRAAVDALDPTDRVAGALARDGVDETRVVVLSAGKAAAAMARGAERALGDRVARALVVTPEAAGDAPEGFTHLVAAHPKPDERSEKAGRAALSLVAGAKRDERVLALISGGASALLCVPAPGLTLSEKVAATSAVMAAGAPIEDLNTVRKHLSAIKGGRLAAASPVPVTTLAASDVVGDPLTAIASGPTVPDPTTFDDACRVVETSCGMDGIPASARDYLEAGRRGDVDDTPKSARPGDRAEVIAGTGALVDEALRAARDGGAIAEELARGVEGDVSEVADDLASGARRAAAEAQRRNAPFCLVAGGEPTIALPPHPGEGGRAHQLALLAAERIAGLEHVVILAAGSDGIDGTTRAAGAAVTGATWDAIAGAGFDPKRALAHCDAAPALAAAGAQIVTGPTGINHADVMIVAAWP